MGFKHTSRRLSSCFSCRRSLTSSCHALNFSELSLVHDIEFQGMSVSYLHGGFYTHIKLTHRFDPQSNLLYPSKTVFPEAPSQLTTLTLRLLSTLRLTELTIDPETQAISESTNLTILNFFLVHLGPMTEKSLVKTLMTTQVSNFYIISHHLVNFFRFWAVLWPFWSVMGLHGLFMTATAINSLIWDLHSGVRLSGSYLYLFF